MRFEFQHGEGDQLSEEELSGEVLAVEPERLLEFRWGKHILRCELIPDGDGCRLLFSETFEDASWGARNAAGWEYCLENLETILRGAAAIGLVMDAWQVRFEHYVSAFQVKFGQYFETDSASCPADDAAHSQSGFEHRRGQSLARPSSSPIWNAGKDGLTASGFGLIRTKLPLMRDSPDPANLGKIDAREFERQVGVTGLEPATF